MVETAGKSILFDPFISPNPLAKDINISKITPDFMLISHGHQDHIADAVEIALQSGCTCIGIWEVMNWLEKQGVTSTLGMNIGGGHDFEFGRIKLTNAVHSSTMPDGSTGGVPCGFIVENSNETFYYAGDTALFGDMCLIPKKHKLKTAFLPIGDNFTMDIYDAVEAAKLVQSKHVIGMHFDTFGYIKIDHTTAIDVFARAGIELVLMKTGEIINI